MRILRDPAPIELRHLRYFLAVMEELHFGRAAERLHMAQPPLSRAIRKLEDGLGVQLLVRSSRAVAPTAAGLAFAGEARKVLASMDHAVSEARHAGGASAELRIGCMFHLKPELLHRFLDLLAERDDEITTQVTHLPTLEQVRRLRAGELDVAIYMDAGEQPDIVTEPLLPGEELVAMVAHSHRLARCEAIRPEDVRDETLIIFPRATNVALHDRARARYVAAGFEFRHVLEATSIHPRDAMVLTAQGRGIYLTFAHVSETGADRARVVSRPLDPAIAAPDTRLAWSARTAEVVGSRVETARDVAREMYSATLVER